MIASLKAIGVDEIACLIDFGVPTDQVLAGLKPLKALRDRYAGSKPASAIAPAARSGTMRTTTTRSPAR